MKIVTLILLTISWMGITGCNQDTTHNEVTGYKIAGSQLELHDASGAVVARFQAVALQ